MIADMDGVLWRGNEALPGLVAFFDFLREKNLPIALATNNSSRSPQDYVTKLGAMGVTGIDPRQIITSGAATASYLTTQYTAGTRIHVVGMPGLIAQIESAGFKAAEDDVAAVVVGIDFEFTYAKAQHAVRLIRNGAAFVGTNGDLTFPSPDGLVPGAGSLIAMIEAASDVNPVVIGKPEPAMFEAALRALGSAASETLMIGDRMNTDIAGAAQLGMPTALLLTGVTTREALGESDSQPDGVFADLPDLMSQWS